MSKLSQQQLIFVQEYYKTQSPKQAAITAGYAAGSASVTASKLLKKANILAELAKLNSQLIKSTTWSREDSIKTLLQVIAKPKNPADVVNAVKVLNQMQGFDAAVKIEHSGAINVIKRILVDPTLPTATTEGAK